MDTEEITSYFARACKDVTKMSQYQTPEEWDYTEETRQLKGAKLFKRKVLGFCGLQTIKSIEGVAEILTEIGVAKSTQEGIDLTNALCGKYLYYDRAFGIIAFDKVKNVNGKCRIRIRKCFLPDDIDD